MTNDYLSEQEAFFRRVLTAAGVGYVLVHDEARPHVDGVNMEVEHAYTRGHVVLYEVDGELVVQRHRNDDGPSAQMTFVNCTEDELAPAIHALIADIAETTRPS